MIYQNSSDALRGQMQDIRRDLNDCADAVLKKARTQFDWRHYVASHPWTALGAAAAVGFFLVPRRACSKTGDPEAVTEAVDRVARAIHPSPLSSAVTGAMSGIAARIAYEGLSLVSQYLREFVKASDKSPERSPAEKSV
jgi:hypothetical protein